MTSLITQKANIINYFHGILVPQSLYISKSYILPKILLLLIHYSFPKIYWSFLLNFIFFYFYQNVVFLR